MKLLLSDLDGTLLTPQKELTPKVLDRINKWKEQGNLFVIATGRVISSAQLFADLTDSSEYVIACSGACVYHRGEKIYEKTVPLELAKKLWELFDESEEYCQIYSNHSLVCNRWGSFLKGYEDYHLRFGEKYRLPIVEMKEFDEKFLPGGIHKLSFVTEEPERAKEILSELGDLSGVNVFRSLPHLYDIISIEADKGIAGLWLKNRLQAEKFFAIGDNENDVAMLKLSNFAAVMEDAPESVLPSGDLVVPDCSKDGVAEFIDYLLQEGL